MLTMELFSVIFTLFLIEERLKKETTNYATAATILPQSFFFFLFTYTEIFYLVSGCLLTVNFVYPFIDLIAFIKYRTKDIAYLAFQKDYLAGETSH